MAYELFLRYDESFVKLEFIRRLYFDIRSMTGNTLSFLPTELLTSSIPFLLFLDDSLKTKLFSVFFLSLKTNVFVHCVNGCRGSGR